MNDCLSLYLGFAGICGRGRERQLGILAILDTVPPQQFQPMTLGRVREAFSHPDWLFELKWDGFRALLYSESDGVHLISRNGNLFRSFPGLCKGLAGDLRGRRCVLDGEIVCLDAQGKSQFRDLLFRRSLIP